jgi:murein L,D-transpeptidase YcbB/YkuD
MKPNPYLILRTCFLILVATMLANCNGRHPQEKGARKVISSKELFSAEEFSRALSRLWPAAPADSQDRKKWAPDSSMRSVYKLSGYRPVWVSPDGITEAAALLLKDLDSLRWDGIDPARYGPGQLAAALEALKSGGDLQQALAFDTACTRAYLQASRELLMGLIPPRKADSLWFHSNDSVWSAPQKLAALADNGAYPALALYRSLQPTYKLLRAEYARYSELARDARLASLKSSILSSKVPDSTVIAIISMEFPWIKPAPGDTMPEMLQRIRGLQERYGLEPTGKLDSNTVKRLRIAPDTVMQLIAANMERLRWMPQAPDSQYVLVNIPLMEMFFRRDGSDAFHMKVVVGRPSRQTPVLDAHLANIVFSPSWGVPPVILKKDVLPGISRRGANYLARKGLQAYDRKGRKVSASAVNAANFRSFSFRQPPGARNALGEVKFNLPNRWDIYLHDTPHREDFPRRYRAKSSGCIRVERPREFAEFILSDIEGREQFDQYRIDSLIRLRKTRYEQLGRKIPVHIVYLTAFEDETGSNVRLLPDIYGKDKKLIAALTRISGI